MATTPTFAKGINKTVALALETTYGTQATAQAQLLRRISCDLSPNIQQIASQEILPSQQVQDVRQGPRQIQGTLSGQLSPATYSMIWQALFRNSFVAGVAATGLTDTVAVVDLNYSLSINGAAEHFMTVTGFKKGDVCRISGLTGTPLADNAENLILTNVTDTALTFAQPIGSEITWPSGQTVSISVVNKKLTVPITGQTDQSFTLEQWFADVAQSYLYTGIKFTQVTLTIPASGNCTFQASMMGQQMAVGSTQVYPSATAASTTTTLTSNAGRIVYSGSVIGYITSANIQIMSDATAPPVVGSNIVPTVAMGTLRVSGSITCFFSADTLTTDFLAENEVTLQVVMTTGQSAGADFISLYLPRVKLFGGTTQDSSTLITRSYTISALLQINGGSGTGWDETTITMQDSLA